MKAICDRGALLDAVNMVSGVVPNRTPRPQLSCIRLHAGRHGGGGLLTLSATDAEISIRLSTTQVDVSEEGDVLIPADKLKQIVSAEDGEPTLTLEASGDACEIRGADATFKVYGYPASEFPSLPEMPRDGGSRFTISAEAFRQLISRTIFSTARENSRYAINGVLLRRTGKKLEMVATDGRRLALARGSADPADGAPDETLCIIPTKALNMAARLVAGSAGDVTVAISDNQVIFAFEEEDELPGTVLTSNLVEGSFPPYEDVIPKDQDKKASFDVDVLSSAVRRAALLTNEESRGVSMAFSSSDGNRLTLSSRAPEMGEAEIKVDMASYDGGDVTIGFNPSFITDALKVIDDRNVTLELKAPNKPGLIRSGNEFLYVVMPVNLK